MKKADIKVGETYWTAKGRSYKYAETKATVIAIGAEKVSRTQVTWDVDAKFGTRKQLEAIEAENAKGTLAPVVYKAKRQAIIDKRNAEVERILEDKPFNVTGKGTGILVDFVNVWNALRGDDTKTTRRVIDSREFQCTWATFEARQRATAEAAEKNRLALEERKKADDALRDALTNALAARGLDIYIGGHTTEVRLSLADALNLINRIPTGVEA